MTQRDFYQVLGVAQDASSRDIRAAFVRLSKLHHPDAAGAEAALPWRLHDVQQAYHCLSDTTTRAAHDRALEAVARQHFARQRSVLHRLRRYDRRHPHPVPRPRRRTRWGVVLVVLLLAALVLLSCAHLTD